MRILLLTAVCAVCAAAQTPVEPRLSYVSDEFAGVELEFWRDKTKLQ